MMCAYTHWRPLSTLPPLPLLHDITDSETPLTPVGLTKSHTLRLHEFKRRSVRVNPLYTILQECCVTSNVPALSNTLYIPTSSLVPRSPLNSPRGKGVWWILYNSFCTSRISAVQSDWLIWQLSQLYWASFPQTTYLYLITPSNLLKPSKTLQKA